jgi:hypothetical protein
MLCHVIWYISTYASEEPAVSLETDAVCSLKLLKNFSQTTWHHIPQDSMLQSQLFESDIPNIFIKFDSFKCNMEMLACVLTGISAQLCYRENNGIKILDIKKANNDATD